MLPDNLLCRSPLTRASAYSALCGTPNTNVALLVTLRETGLISEIRLLEAGGYGWCLGGIGAGETGVRISRREGWLSECERNLRREPTFALSFGVELIELDHGRVPSRLHIAFGSSVSRNQNHEMNRIYDDQNGYTVRPNLREGDDGSCSSRIGPPSEDTSVSNPEYSTALHN